RPRALAEHLLAPAEDDRVHPQAQLVEEPLGDQGLHQVDAADHVHVAVALPQVGDLGGQVCPDPDGALPVQADACVAGGHILRHPVEQPADLAVRTGGVEGPVAGEDVVGAPTEEQGVQGGHPVLHALAHRLAGYAGLPATEPEVAAGVFVRSARGLCDAVEGGEQVDDDLSGHGVLPVLVEGVGGVEGGGAMWKVRAKRSSSCCSPRTTVSRSCSSASAGVTSPAIRRRMPGPATITACGSASGAGPPTGGAAGVSCTTCSSPPATCTRRATSPTCSSRSRSWAVAVWNEVRSAMVSESGVTTSPAAGSPMAWNPQRPIASRIGSSARPYSVSS